MVLGVLSAWQGYWEGIPASVVPRMRQTPGRSDRGGQTHYMACLVRGPQKDKHMRAGGPRWTSRAAAGEAADGGGPKLIPRIIHQVGIITGVAHSIQNGVDVLGAAA